MNSHSLGCGKRTLECDAVYHYNNLIPNKFSEFNFNITEIQFAQEKWWEVTHGFNAGLAWSNASISWQDLDLVRSVGASECELQLNVPRQCWAGGFICSDRLLTVCDDERQLRVGAEHRFFSWQRELWRLEGARACISRPPLLLILPSKVLLLRPQTYLTIDLHALQTPAKTWWKQWTQALYWLLFQHLTFLLHQHIILQ